MKKLINIFLFLLIIIPLLIACKDDETPAENKKSLLLGTWSVTQFNVDLSIGGISLADFLIDSLNFSSQEVTIAEALIRSEVNDVFENETISFKENNTYEILIENNIETGSWELNQEQTVLSIYPIADQEIQFQINSLSEEILKITLNEALAIDEFLATPNSGLPFTSDLQIDGAFTLIKQN